MNKILWATFALLLSSCGPTKSQTSQVVSVARLSSSSELWCKDKAPKVYEYCYNYSFNVYRNPNEEYTIFQSLRISNYAKKRRLEDKQLNGKDLVSIMELADYAWPNAISNIGIGPVSSVNNINKYKTYASKYICLIAVNNAKFKRFNPNIATPECRKQFKVN